MIDDLSDRSWIDVDPNHLDKEWLGQPRLYSEYAEHLAEARFDHAEAKNKLELVMAEVARLIRSDPISHGVKKVTVDAIKDAVTLHVEVQNAQKKLNKKKYDLDLLQACVDTLDQRKKTLEHLVQLRLADYFSEPRGPKGIERSEVDAALGSKQGRKERR